MFEVEFPLALADELDSTFFGKSLLGAGEEPADLGRRPVDGVCLEPSKMLLLDLEDLTWRSAGGARLSDFFVGSPVNTAQPLVFAAISLREPVNTSDALLFVMIGNEALVVAEVA